MLRSKQLEKVFKRKFILNSLFNLNSLSIVGFPTSLVCWKYISPFVEMTEVILSDFWFTGAIFFLHFPAYRECFVSIQWLQTGRAKKFNRINQSK